MRNRIYTNLSLLYQLQSLNCLNLYDLLSVEEYFQKIKKILKFIKKLKVQLTFKIKLNNKSIVDLLLYKKDPLRGSISLT